jgi:hypothetical protein
VQVRVWLFVTVVALKVPDTAVAVFPWSSPRATAMPVVANIATTAVASINFRIRLPP